MRKKIVLLGLVVAGLVLGISLVCEYLSVLVVFDPNMFRDIYKQESGERGQVFLKSSEYWVETQTLIAYKDELILAIGGSGSSDLPGVWTTKDGVTWSKKYSKAPSDWWASQLFNNDLYLGGSYGADWAQITKYDGSSFTEVFKEADGLGGGQGCVEALGIFDNYLFAGRKNEIWRSADGTEWTKVFTFATNKGIYQFGEDAGGFLAFEGEPILAPCKVYFTEDGENWVTWASVHDVEWFRSHSPSDRIRLGQFLFIGDGNGHILIRENDIWNSQVLRVFHSEGANVVAMKCKRIGNYLGICSGSGTGHKQKGTFWIWDGNSLRLLAELPMSIFDFELFQGNIYLACTSITKDRWSEEYSTNQICLLRLPENIIKDSKPAPMTITLFDERPISTDGYAAGFIPILGYENVNVFIHSSQSGSLVLRVFDETISDWRDIETVSITANTPTVKIITWRGKFLRVFFQPSLSATVSLWVTLS